MSGQKTSDLNRFSEYPDASYVRIDVVKQLFACSTSSVWRLSKTGRIPAPKKISPGITAWNVGELRKSLNSLLTN